MSARRAPALLPGLMCDANGPIQLSNLPAWEAMGEGEGDAETESRRTRRSFSGLRKF